MVNISLDKITLIGKNSEDISVSDISMDIKAGEFLVLVAPINNGKSQILKMIAGLIKPNSGTVFFDGKSLNEFSPNYEKLAMVLESQALYPHLTLRKNLEFGLKIVNMPKETINARIAEIANLLEISSLLDLTPKQLSGSQRQLAAIARAFVKRPQVLIFDEPISELDSHLKIRMQSVIKRFCINLQATVVYATHNPSEAMTVGDRIVCIHEGKIQQIGTSYELYSKPANEIVARFIGYPEMNFIEFETGDDCKILNLIDASYSITVPKKIEDTVKYYKRAKIGVRAENLRIVPEKPNAIPMIVEMQEYTGSQSILYVSREQQTLAVEISLNEHYELGDTVYTELSESGIHLFVDGKIVI
ncbi:MAG: ABC transporter ATP-binding protein [Fibromonadaceae bacterium]|jgi:ABC-type sugar transport system ATPase subunit|nr:ABC transporter ATP-binding protein [Fibromonadaceae bacterium]